MNIRTILITIIFWGVSALSIAQDMTGTWEGALWGGNLSMSDRAPKIVTGTGLSQPFEPVQGGAIDGLQRQSTMIWELLQCDRTLYGVVYFFSPEATVPGKPYACFTWMGKKMADTSVSFTFIQGKSLDGLLDLPFVQFNVHMLNRHDTLLLYGNVYRTIESLHTLEKNNGSFTMQKLSNTVRSPYWAEWKKASVKEKLKDCWLKSD